MSRECFCLCLKLQLFVGRKKWFEYVPKISTRPFLFSHLNYCLFEVVTIRLNILLSLSLSLSLSFSHVFSPSFRPHKPTLTISHTHSTTAKTLELKERSFPSLSHTPTTSRKSVSISVFHSLPLSPFMLVPALFHSTFLTRLCPFY